MIDPFLLSLGLKLAAAALVVISAALLVERSGPFLGAMIVSLPISAGPAYVFLAMEHPSEFVAASALASLVTNAASPIYMAIYARLAQTCGLVVSLGPALAAWLVLAGGALSLEWTLAEALALNMALYALGGWLMRGLGRMPGAPKAAKSPWDLVVRVIAVMLVAGAVILVARRFGPKAAGLVALVPIGFSTMAFVVHARAGGPTSAAVFANALPGMVGFVAALVTVNAAVVPLGSAAGLAAALAVSIVWNGALVVLQRWRGPR